MVPPPTTWISAFRLSDAAIHAFAAAMQGVVLEGVGEEPPYPSPDTPVGRVVDIFLLHLSFTCGVEGDGDLDSICKDVARSKVSTEGLSTLNQYLLQRIPYFQGFFGGRVHFSTSIPLLPLKKRLYDEPLLVPRMRGVGGSPH